MFFSVEAFNCATDMTVLAVHVNATWEACDTKSIFLQAKLKLYQVENCSSQFEKLKVILLCIFRGDVAHSESFQ